MLVSGTFSFPLMFVVTGHITTPIMCSKLSSSPDLALMLAVECTLTRSASSSCVIPTIFTSFSPLTLMVGLLVAPSITRLPVQASARLTSESCVVLVLRRVLVLVLPGWRVLGSPGVLQDGDLQVVVLSLWGSLLYSFWSTSCSLESSTPSYTPYGVHPSPPGLAP